MQVKKNGGFILLQQIQGIGLWNPEKSGPKLSGQIDCQPNPVVPDRLLSQHILALMPLSFGEASTVNKHQKLWMLN
jgi:hypothetical protein